MRDPARIKRILRRVYRIWQRHPDLRLMQLLIAACKEPEGQSLIPHMVEDDALEEKLDLFTTKYSSAVDRLADLTVLDEDIFLQQ